MDKPSPKANVLKGNGTKFFLCCRSRRREEEEDEKFVKMADGTGSEFFIFISAEKCEHKNSRNWISREQNGTAVERQRETDTEREKGRETVRGNRASRSDIGDSRKLQ